MASKNDIKERRASDVLFSEIIASKNSLRRHNIEALKRACDQMEQDHIEITLAEAARRSGEDGPKYSTVSNKGSLLGEYVRLRIAEQQAGKTLPSGQHSTRSVADDLNDPLLQARVRDLESISRYMKRENVALRALLKNLRPGVDIDRLIAGGPNTDAAALAIEAPSVNVVENDELAAVLFKLLDHLIGERQYSFHRGRLAINNKAVLSVQELEVIRKVTGLSEADWQLRYKSNSTV